MVVVGTFVLCKSVPKLSRDPRVGILLPGVGLWYPRGETLGCLAVKCSCDPIHIVYNSWLKGKV
jgi:hypothetical protein